MKTKHPLYGTWKGMKGRCNIKNHADYLNYGGRGIKVCKEWETDFWQFVNDMGEKPTPSHTIDRINNDKGYYPENCKWSTPSEQIFNQRVRKDNTIGVRGIQYRSGSYSVRKVINGKRVILGSYDTLEEAKEAYKTGIKTSIKGGRDEKGRFTKATK